MPAMATHCSHLDRFDTVTPGSDGCAECLAHGGRWVHLRIATQHPVMESYDPPDPWGWCYVDEAMIDLGENVTAHPPGWRY